MAGARTAVGNRLDPPRKPARVRNLTALPITAAMGYFNSGVVGRIGIMLAVVGNVFEVVMANSVYKPLADDSGHFTDGLIAAGRRKNQSLPPHTTIAVIDAGALAHYSERLTIDMVGLNDTHIAHSRLGADGEYFLIFRPMIIQPHASTSPTGKLDLLATGLHDIAIIQQPESEQCYALDLARSPGRYYPYLYLRTCPWRLSSSLHSPRWPRGGRPRARRPGASIDAVTCFRQAHRKPPEEGRWNHT
jgi:hypothetical protein